MIKQLNVQQLIDLLMEVEDKTLPVRTEGCGCTGKAKSIEIRKSYLKEGSFQVLITRLSPDEEDEERELRNINNLQANK